MKNPPRGGQAALDQSIAFFRRSGAYHRLYFVCHTPRGTLRADAADNIHLWAGKPLAEAAVKSGLFDWLMQRTA